MNWLDLGGALSTLTAAGIAAYLGIPAWRLQRDQIHEKEAAQKREQSHREQAELAVSVAKYLGVPVPDALQASGSIPDPSPDHPVLIDVLRDIRDSSRDAARDSAQTAVALAYHMADGHGPEPHHIRRWADLRAEAAGHDISLDI